MSEFLSSRQKVELDLEDENPDALFLDGHDDAIIGVARRGDRAVVAYDTRVILEKLTSQGMSEDEALEFFDVNIAGAWMGENTPWLVEVVVPGEVHESDA